MKLEARNLKAEFHNESRSKNMKFLTWPSSYLWSRRTGMPVGRKLEPTRILTEYPGHAIEMFAVAIIVIALVHGTIRYLIRINQQVGDAYSF